MAVNGVAHESNRTRTFEMWEKRKIQCVENVITFQERQLPSRGADRRWEGERWSARPR